MLLWAVRHGGVIFFEAEGSLGEKQAGRHWARMAAGLEAGYRTRDLSTI